MGLPARPLEVSEMTMHASARAPAAGAAALASAVFTEGFGLTLWALFSGAAVVVLLTAAEARSALLSAGLSLAGTLGAARGLEALGLLRGKVLARAGAIYGLAALVGAGVIFDNYDNTRLHYSTTFDDSFYQSSGGGTRASAFRPRVKRPRGRGQSMSMMALRRGCGWGSVGVGRQTRADL
ncbi:MAG: hypothetical protein HY909_16565 [Deltaproteobacteria bacterium]|nr:hypothetical protein [Deltaproteobacteria bacterium]